MKIEIRELKEEDQFEMKVIYPADADGDIDFEELERLYREIALIPDQTHSLNVGMATSMGESFPDTDALVTFSPELTIGVRTADCVPIILYCSNPACVAVVHAGWKGTLGGILDNVIDILEEHEVRVKDIYAVFGPSISMANYEVDEELASRFAEAGYDGQIHCPEGPESKPHIDLQGVNVQRLLDRGVPLRNIKINEGCTFGSIRDDGSHIYQSHRRSGGRPGRNLTLTRLIRENITTVTE
ncbi:MAG: polyphenol oxidase family protein [Muribaculaceae bacterium]|nr:polyphenol oxidase family protein [Muribaculaceae bacterium]